MALPAIAAGVQILGGIGSAIFGGAAKRRARRRQRKLANQIEQVREVARRAGRDPENIGIECIVPTNTDVDRLKSLQEIGVSHVAMVTMNQELADPEAHIDAISSARDVLATAFG